MLTLALTILLVAALVLRPLYAIPAKTGQTYLELRRSGSAWYLVPFNNEGKVALDAAFLNDSAKTVVAITQEDAGRGGFGDTNQPYKAVKLALS